MLVIIEQFLIAALITQYKCATCGGCMGDPWGHRVGCLYIVYKEHGW